jgi:hypothetical protein
LINNLPEFLPTWGVEAPSIWVFFDIFIGKHRLVGPAVVVQIQDSLGEKPIRIKRGDEEFIDSLTHALASLPPPHLGRSGMSNHYRVDLRQTLSQFQPPSIKELNHLSGVHAPHPRCGWMSWTITAASPS